MPPSTETLLDLTPVAPGKTVDDVLSARGEYGKAMAYKASKENAPLPTGATIRCPRCGTKSEIEFHYAGSLGGRLGMCVGPADRKQPCAACGSPPGEECRLRCSNEVLPKERNTNAAPAPQDDNVATLIERAEIAWDEADDGALYRLLAAALESLAREQSKWHELHRVMAEEQGATPDIWPDHGNAPLAIAAVFMLVKQRAEQAVRDHVAWVKAHQHEVNEAHRQKREVERELAGWHKAHAQLLTDKIWPTDCPQDPAFMLFCIHKAREELAAERAKHHPMAGDTERLLQIGELQAELAAAREDAERYRWLRERVDTDGVYVRFPMVRPPAMENILWGSFGDHLDAAIDAAMRKK